MKIKHWQGYGSVNARKISATKDCLVVEVKGEHEYGLVREDAFDVFGWLVSRFDKSRKDWLEIKSISVEEATVDNPKAYRGYDDVCRYTIRFRS